MGSRTQGRGKGIQKSSGWDEGIWEPVAGTPGSGYHNVRTRWPRFLGIRHSAAELGDPRLAAWGSGTQCCMGTLALVPAGAGVWVFRYGGYVRLWLGCQDPLAGLWGIQWLRREVQDVCVCIHVYIYVCTYKNCETKCNKPYYPNYMQHDPIFSILF